MDHLSEQEAELKETKLKLILRSVSPSLFVWPERGGQRWNQSWSTITEVVFTLRKPRGLLSHHQLIHVLVEHKF